MSRELLKNIRTVFFAMFFFSLYVATTGYINSSFMESFGWNNATISLIYAANSILTLILLIYSQKIINKIGVRKLLLTFLILLGTVIIGLLVLPQTFAHFIFFILLLALNSLIIFGIDIVLEHFSTDEFTGRIRGLFLVMINLTWAIAPMPAGYLIERFGISSIYILGCLWIVCTILIFLFHFRTTTFEKKPSLSFKQSFHKFLKNRNRKNIFILAFFLQLFYASSTIYMPLHLHNIIGFDWSEIGLLLMITNIPFLIFQYPVGKLADSYFGEKEMMITGYLIGGIACVLFAIISLHNLLIWACLLFFSRIGISIVEATTESYFFKITDSNDVESISFQRRAIPLGYLIAPTIAVIAGIFSTSYSLIFLIVAIMLFIALYPANQIIDTK